MKGVGSFLLGVLVGSLGVAMYRRIEEHMEEESEADLAERMSRHLDELEARAEGKPSPAKPSVAKSPVKTARAKAATRKPKAK